jgi:DNA/RNA-binding domain of Phe-tRNA-synthetase-like protein
MLDVDPHPSLAYAAFTTELPRPLGQMPSPDWLKALLALDATAPVARTEELRAAVRDMLRHGGYKPTGRGKPASEYLVRAASEGQLASINLVVDACNVVSLASGIPISVIDLDGARAPLHLSIAPQGAKYVFNSAGQVIDVGGLLCLCDADGPTANAVKDAMRTKTNDATRRTLSVLWSARGFERELAAATAWYRELLLRAGAKTDPA